MKLTGPILIMLGLFIFAFGELAAGAIFFLIGIVFSVVAALTRS